MHKFAEDYRPIFPWKAHHACTNSLKTKTNTFGQVLVKLVRLYAHHWADVTRNTMRRITGSYIIWLRFQAWPASRNSRFL